MTGRQYTTEIAFNIEQLIHNQLRQKLIKHKTPHHTKDYPKPKNKKELN
jgi:hypothetical protein